MCLLVHCQLAKREGRLTACVRTHLHAVRTHGCVFALLDQGQSNRAAAELERALYLAVQTLIGGVLLFELARDFLQAAGMTVRTVNRPIITRCDVLLHVREWVRVWAALVRALRWRFLALLLHGQVANGLLFVESHGT